MPGTSSVPNTFATQSGNVPASQLDANWTALTVYINAREITIGTLAARPAAGTAGAWYLASDQNGGTLFTDNGSTWVQVAAPVTVNVASGGTGSATLLAHAILIGEGTSAIQGRLLAKGELVVGQTGNDPVALPVSTNGFVLTLDSAQTLGLKWAAAGGVGSGISIGEFYGLQPTRVPVL